MDHRVHFYISRTSTADFPRLEACYLWRLRGNEQARYHRFTSVRRKLEWLTGRALCLEGLAATLGHVNAPALRTDEKGNIVYDDASVTLSLSHSHGMVVSAISTGPVGVDVERMRLRALIDRTQGVFAPEESRHLTQTNDAARTRLFYQYWTLKEATCKAAGVSIREGLTAARFDLRSTPVFIGFAERLIGPWRFWSATLDAHWQLAIAARGTLITDVFTAWRMTLPGARSRLSLNAFASFISR